jgi:hypothetical protein
MTRLRPFKSLYSRRFVTARREAFGVHRKRWRMRSSPWLWLVCISCGLGCAQKDPGAKPGSGKDAGDNVESVADDFYPMVAGSVLTTRHSGSGSPWDDKTQITATQVGGNAAYLTEGAPDPKGETSQNTVIRIGTRILRSHKQEFKAGVAQGTVDYEPGFIRFDSAWVDAADGFSENVAYKRIEKTAAGSVISEDDREHIWTVEKRKDTVSVPAGDFKDCLRVRRTRIRGNAANTTDDDDKVFWFCAGLGKVKELSEIGGGNEELVSCVIPGGLCP